MISKLIGDPRYLWFAQGYSYRGAMSWSPRLEHRRLCRLHLIFRFAILRAQVISRIHVTSALASHHRETGEPHPWFD